MNYNPSRLKVGGLLAIVVMTLTAAVSPMSMSWTNQAQAERQSLAARLTVLHRAEELLVDAETGQRGYIITGKDTFLQPYHAALSALPGQLRLLESSYDDEREPEHQLVSELLTSVQHKLNSLAETLQVRQASGFDASALIVSSGRGKKDMDEVRRIVSQIDAIESRRLATLDNRLKDKSWWAMLLSIGSTAVTVLLLGSLASMMSRAIQAGITGADETRESNEKLERNMLSLRRRNQEALTLGEMSRVLQAEMSLMEAASVTGMFCSRLLPGSSGAIYLLRTSAALLELGGHWGTSTPSPEPLEPATCWGLRRGQLHTCSDATHLRCSHYPADDADAPTGSHLCFPLMAYGEMLGLMHLHLPDGVEADLQLLAQTISEQVGLSLSSVKLRQALRDQSIRDGLTGLHNRRYMEETLTRELARAQRTQAPLSVVVVDLDHFKKINDSHGHPAGDAVLRATAQRLASMMRTSDVVCRYGGEEFVLILPDCDLTAAAAKAEEIRHAIRQMDVHEGEHAIRVTASFGVSSTTSGREGPQPLIAAADRALYEAKRGGRDQVAIAHALPALAMASVLEDTDRREAA